MCQLNIRDGHILTVKCLNSGMSSVSSLDSKSYSSYVSLSLLSDSASAGNHLSYFLDQERVLPGVVMAAGGQVFEKLHLLSTHEDSNCVPVDSGRWRHHLSPPPQFRHGTGGEGNILPPAPMVSAATAHKTFRPTDLTIMFSMCIWWYWASNPGPVVWCPML
ncbi:ubiquitin carboxyl-terminal hydrolase 24 [Trichonephila clavipes]|nr:ubiquitin carboxyl-terminal hydrolase 24 [Trichonephila clavipes]